MSYSPILMPIQAIPITLEEFEILRAINNEDKRTFQQMEQQNRIQTTINEINTQQEQSSQEPEFKKRKLNITQHSIQPIVLSPFNIDIPNTILGNQEAIKEHQEFIDQLFNMLTSNNIADIQNGPTGSFMNADESADFKHNPQLETREANPIASAYTGPVYNGPVYNGPVYNGPVYNGPVYNGPAYNGPVYNGPVYNGPLYNDLGNKIFKKKPHNLPSNEKIIETIRNNEPLSFRDLKLIFSSCNPNSLHNRCKKLENNRSIEAFVEKRFVYYTIPKISQ